MSNVTHGMNVDEVEALGQLLQGKADQLRHVVNDLEGALGRTIWEGPDAVAFKQQWWPDHRARLQAVAEHVHGFGQSALNNASEQRTASGVASDGESVRSAPRSTLPTPPPSAAELAGSSRSEDEVLAAYRDNYRKYGLWADGAPGGKNEYQCVSWAWFRMRELGFDGAQMSADGGELAGRLGGTTTTVPVAGAVISGNPPGHVMVAEQVSQNPDGSFAVRVSEMNMGRNGVYPALPWEYQDMRVVTWRPGGQMVVFNPLYGTPKI